MCGTCGCGKPDETLKIYLPNSDADYHEHQHEHVHMHGGLEHSHAHMHGHSHGNDSQAHEHDHDTLHHQGHHEHTHEVLVQQDVLQRNDRIAERNRGYFEALGIAAFNMVSSPGSGKTTLLEKTIERMASSQPIRVIEGDQQTSNDARRIEAAGAKSVQINTGVGCHLDASMVKRAVDILNPPKDSYLFIENVGNLVCPAMFDLGENKRVVVISVTEGDDKPLKYPNMFQTAHLCIINKMDLLPYVPFDLGKLKEAAMKVNHHLEFIELSAMTGDGMEAWIEWLASQK